MGILPEPIANLAHALDVTQGENRYERYAPLVALVLVLLGALAARLFAPDDPVIEMILTGAWGILAMIAGGIVRGQMRDS